MGLFSFFKTLFGNKRPIKPERSFMEKCANPEYNVTGYFLYVTDLEFRESFNIEKFLRGDYDGEMGEKYANPEAFEEKIFYTNLRELVLDPSNLALKGHRLGESYIIQLVSDPKDILSQSTKPFHKFIQGAFDFNLVGRLILDNQLTAEKAEKLILTKEKFDQQLRPT